jgi:hypothetical protein
MKKIVPFTLIFMVLSIVFGILSCTSPAVQHTENAKALYFEDKYDEAIAESGHELLWREEV